MYGQFKFNKTFWKNRIMHLLISMTKQTCKPLKIDDGTQFQHPQERAVPLKKDSLGCLVLVILSCYVIWFARNIKVAFVFILVGVLVLL